jgi:hypothetical protein
MAGDQNPEIAVEAVISILTASLPAALDAIDTAMADTITLRDLARYYRAPLQDYDALPCAVVMCSSTDYLDPLRREAVRAHELQLQVYEECHEATTTKMPQEVLAARLERTMKGIDTVLAANPTLTVASVEKADHCMITGVQYSNFVDRGGRGVFRGALMSLRVYFST